VCDDAVLVCGMQLFYQRRRHNARKQEPSTHVPAAGQQEVRRPASSQATAPTLTQVEHTHASTPNTHTHTHTHTHSQTHKHTHTHSHTPQPPRCSAECPRRNALVIQRSGSTQLRRGSSAYWRCCPCGPTTGRRAEKVLRDGNRTKRHSTDVIGHGGVQQSGTKRASVRSSQKVACSQGTRRRASR
jgi:hypothetical protein